MARPAHHEHGGLVEDPVERAQQRVVAGEELRPVAGDGVAREDHGVGPVLLVAAVDDVEEEVGAVAVEPAATTKSPISSGG